MNKGIEMILGSIDQMLPVFIMDDTGAGIGGVLASTLAGQYTKQDGLSEVALSFFDGIGAAYVSGKWAENGAAGNYLYGYPDLAWDTLGVVSITITATGAVVTRISANVEYQATPMAIQTKWTNVVSDPPGDNDEIIVSFP